MATANCWGDETDYDFNALVDGLNRYLRLKATPIGLKRFRTVAEMEAVPRVRRPDPREKFAMDQIVGQTRWIGWTLGITMDNLMGQQCGTVVGLAPRDKEWLSGDRMHGVWYGTLEDSAAHQAAMSCASHGDYAALVTSPLTAGRIDNPDICLIYATPGQMITFVNGLQYTGYKKYTFTVVGESACADSWGRALATGEPSLSLPCYAERKFGGVQDDELLIALPPSFLPQTVEGLAALSKNGLRYPIPNHGIQKSPLDSIETSYGKS
ncbi:MAG: DUF169 domain-containing protein [Gammaproteobacteria bacterium]|nr:DUF169 domain-containing protein [Gammaproteobacteria bacterium]MCP5202207.1 DUF169 domain-containing protein [Gammaproteobacteria bacterium]